MSEPPKLLKFEQKTDVKETLEELLPHVDGLKGVIVIGLCHNGEQILRTSTFSVIEKAFLLQFLNAYSTHAWFALDEEE